MTISNIGEMRDTAELNPTLQFIKENFLSKEDLMHMFRYILSHHYCNELRFVIEQIVLKSSSNEA